MKKGFTLIELLAVIIVLALILLIAVPMILGVIEKAKKGAIESDAKLIIDAIEKKMAIDDTFVYADITEDNIEEKLGIKPINYKSLQIKEVDGKPKIIIEGQNKYDGYTAYGNKEDIKVIKSSDYDEIPPVITLVGSNPLEISQGDTFEDPGATASDNKDGNITSDIVVTGTVNVNTVGNYTLTYRVTDSGGNSASATRTVKVVSPIALLFGGTGDDRFSDGIEVSDGYIAVGYTNSNDGDLIGLNKGGVDAIIVKFDKNGNVLWKDDFGGSGNDYFASITEASDGYLVAGRSNSTNAPFTNRGGWEAIIIKYDFNGNRTAVARYGGTSTDNFTDVVAINNGYVAIGQSSSTDYDLTGLNKGGTDAIIVKYDSSNNVVWKKNLGGTQVDSMNKLIFDGADLVVIGSSASSDKDFTGLNYGQNDAFILKYDLNGSSFGLKNYGGSSYDYFYDVVKVNDGYIVVGSSNSIDYNLLGLNKVLTDGIIVKYSLDLNLVWKKNFGGTNDDSFDGMSLLNNQVIAVGYSQSSDGDLSGSFGSVDAIAAKYDLNGNLISNVHVGGSSADQFKRCYSKNNGIVAFGYSDSSNWISNPKGSNDGLLMYVKP